jgi:aerobic carbon-monoxide dehydrogenase small subunit
MSTARDINLTVNGERVARRVEARQHLIDFLRLDLGLMGTHTGCEHGLCGACTVRVDGKIVRGCLVLAISLDGAKVETIEGVSDSGEIRDLQEAFVARNACQCGYCTPGMLLTAADLLASKADPTREEIREHLSGNYCRCTGYHAIVDAVETVASARAKSATRSPPHRAEGASSTRRGEGLGVGGNPTFDALESPPPQPSPTRREGVSARNGKGGS